jgi:regulator of sirC expression with transglutaminase-like and TPR domain
VTGQTLQDAHLRASSSPEIVVRMLHNLLNLAQGREDSPAMLRYLDAILVVAPDSAQDRLLRSLVLMRLERKEDARRDVDWLLKNKPEGVSLPRLRQLRDYLDQEE